MGRGLTVPGDRPLAPGAAARAGAAAPLARRLGAFARRRPYAGIAAACVGLAALSLLLPSTPTYDPWAWIVWGREIAHLDLSTAEGPSWKPLPVLFTVPFSIFGEAAPALWLVVARASALLALALVWRLAARLGGHVAGAAAAAGLVLSAGFVRNAALGNSEGMLVAAVLLGVERHLDGRRDHALLAGVAAALLRPEAWPFLALYAAWLWLREPARRRLIVIALAAVPALWLGPELWGSGDALRASARAQDPSRFSPAFADYPALEILRLTWKLVAAVLWAGAAVEIAWAVRRRRRRENGTVVLALAAGAGAWVLLVAAMTQAGYAGNQRYLVLPAAIACALGGAGLARAGRAAAGAARLRGPAAAAAVVAFVIAVLAPFAVAQAQSVAEHMDKAGEEARVNADLDAAVERVGGRAGVLRCGTPYTGPYEVPAVAWHLSLHTAQVGLEPRRPGVVFRKRAALSRFGLPRRGDGFRRSAREGGVDVLAACRDGAPLRVRGANAERDPARGPRLGFSDRSGRFTTLPAAWSR